MAKYNTRIQQKHDTEANWNLSCREELEPEKRFVPLSGEVILYDADENHEFVRMKIGDGVTNVKELPFFSSQVQITTWEADD